MGTVFTEFEMKLISNKKYLEKKIKQYEEFMEKLKNITSFKINNLPRRYIHMDDLVKEILSLEENQKG
jgi:hypothetical protein